MITLKKCVDIMEQFNLEVAAYPKSISSVFLVAEWLRDRIKNEHSLSEYGHHQAV